VWLNRFTTHSIGEHWRPGIDPRITTAILSDALDAAGWRNQVMSAAIRPLVKGMRASGHAATVAFGPVDHDVDAPYDEMIAFIDGLDRGAVVVAATGSSERSAFWGELFSTAAIARGAAGLVCDGYIRDTPGIEELGFAAFAPGSRPIDMRARMEVTARGAAVECGGVAVAPGDLVLADDDGVVVVPQEVEADVLARATEKAERESTVRDELLAGATLREVWDRHRVL
jgi:4-hydroxy-4-methyl-2-oxoglutarate aldolase